MPDCGAAAFPVITRNDPKSVSCGFGMIEPRRAEGIKTVVVATRKITLFAIMTQLAAIVVITPICLITACTGIPTADEIVGRTALTSRSVLINRVAQASAE